MLDASTATSCSSMSSVLSTPASVSSSAPAPSRPSMALMAGSHVAELFSSDHLSSSSPAIASLVLPSIPSTVSPTSTSLEASKTAPATASGNATHAKGQTGMNGGRWTEQEHQSFLAGLRLYGREWKKVASKIKTRTSAQIRSHAQKYFAKLARDEEMRKHSGLPLSTAVAPPLAGYFSDGGSSVAHNSGDDDADADADATRAGTRSGTRLSAMKQSEAQMLFSPMGAAVNGLYKPTTAHHGPGNKKRSRSLVSGPGTSVGLGSSVSSGFMASASQVFGAPANFPYKLQKRTPSAPTEAARVDHLPSQEELLAKVSPNVRPRLASLIEAELCALQVLSCYAMLQQQSQPSASRQKPKQRAARPRKLAAAPAATGSGNPASSLGLSILSTEQIPSTSSIY